MSYNSKYSGQQVENLLDQVAGGNVGGGGGGITVELDPIFSASPAAEITDTNILEWNNKVDKVEGKQLSTEDFTTLLKQKLEGLSNYDDTAINNALSGLQTQINTLVSGNASTAIESFNEIIAFLNGVTDSQSLDSIIASIEQQIAAKYTKPTTGIPKSDLASAVQTSLGKADTALQSYTEQYKGTVTSVKINGSTKTPDTSGMVDLGTIEGGSSFAYPRINHGISDVDIDLTPNTFHVWDEVSELYLNIPTMSDVTKTEEYLFQFTSGVIPTTLSLSDEVQWVNGEPNVEANKTYQISIVNNIGIVVSV